MTFGGEAWQTAEKALFEGTVEFTDEGCPYAEGPDVSRIGLVFPNAEGFDNPCADEPRMICASFKGGSSGVMAVEGESVSRGGDYRGADDQSWTGSV